MDFTKNARQAWIVAIISSLVALVLLIVLLSGGGSRDLSDVQAQIREDCTAGDDQSRTRCVRALAQLESILQEIGEDIQRPDAAVPVE